MTPLAIAGLGVQELLIILAVVLLLFGGSRLAGLGKSSGRALREFKEETKGLRDKDGAAKDASAPRSPADPTRPDPTLSDPTLSDPTLNDPALAEPVEPTDPNFVQPPRGPHAESADPRTREA